MNNVEFQNVTDYLITDIFKNETEFNNWLSENLEHLNRLFNVSLESNIDDREISKERLRVDILARFYIQNKEGEPTEHKAVIECQVTESDSKHLGQLLTYGNQHNATYCIWIAPSFKIGHLRTISILNQMEDERYYFAVTPEFFSIGESAKSVRFNFAQEPPDQPLEGSVGKRSHFRSNQEPISETLYSFWEKIRLRMREFTWFNRDKSSKDRYYQFGSGLNNQFGKMQLGWRFTKIEEEDRFMSWIDIYKGEVDGSTKYPRFVIQQLEKSSLEYEIKSDETQKYGRIYLLYPEKISPYELDISEDNDGSVNLVDWAVKSITELREVLYKFVPEIKGFNTGSFLDHKSVKENY